MLSLTLRLYIGLSIVLVCLHHSVCVDDSLVGEEQLVVVQCNNTFFNIQLSRYTGYLCSFTHHKVFY